MTLFIDQQHAFDKLSQLRAGALFMDMGTGKTRVALELAKDKKQEFDLIIWIAPASLIRNLEYIEEVKKWAGDIQKTIRYFTIESLSMSDRIYMELRSLAEKLRIFCIVDETITIKNTEAGRTRRLLSMWNLFDFRLILNGTPVSKGLIDLYSQIQFIHPKILNMTETQFASNFLTYRLDGQKPWKRWSKPENEQALIETIRPYIFESALNIEAKITTQNHHFNLNSNERESYENFKDGFLKEKYMVDFLPMAQAFQAQYTMCTDKLAIAQSIAKTKEKIIFYVKFLKEIDALKEIFPHSIEYSGRKKDKLEDFLHKDCQIMISTYGSGSLGLNLQSCKNLVFFTQTFDYKDKIQSLHRVFRYGQKSNVIIHDFWVKTGLEDLIFASLEKKENLLRNVKKTISKEEAKNL